MLYKEQEYKNSCCLEAPERNVLAKTEEKISTSSICTQICRTKEALEILKDHVFELKKKISPILSADVTKELQKRKEYPETCEMTAIFIDIANRIYDIIDHVEEIKSNVQL